MHEERKLENTRWISHKQLRFRIKSINDFAVVWVSKHGADLSFSLVLYDFLERCNDDFNLLIETDSSWDKGTGFRVKNNEIDLLVGAIIEFDNHWEIEPDSNKLSDDEWYSI